MNYRTILFDIDDDLYVLDAQLLTNGIDSKYTNVSFFRVLFHFISTARIPYGRNNTIDVIYYNLQGTQRGIVRRTINEDSQYVQIKPRMNGTNARSNTKSVFSVGKFR